MTNFEKLYNEVIKKSLVEKFGYKNPHEIPKLTKIVLNMADCRPETAGYQSP